MKKIVHKIVWPIYVAAHKRGHAAVWLQAVLVWAGNIYL